MIRYNKILFLSIVLRDTTCSFLFLRSLQSLSAHLISLPFFSHSSSLLPVLFMSLNTPPPTPPSSSCYSLRLLPFLLWSLINLFLFSLSTPLLFFLQLHLRSSASGKEREDSKVKALATKWWRTVPKLVH